MIFLGFIISTLKIKERFIKNQTYPAADAVPETRILLRIKNILNLRQECYQNKIHWLRNKRQQNTLNVLYILFSKENK